MKKKILFSTLIITFFTLFYVSFASANTQQMGNSIMGGIEDAAHGVGNVASGAVQGVENIASDAANGVKDIGSKAGSAMQNTSNSMVGMTNDNSGYTAERTSVGDQAILFGMNANTLTWIILGLVAAAIISLIWAYMRERDDVEEHQTH